MRRDLTTRSIILEMRDRFEIGRLFYLLFYFLFHLPYAGITFYLLSEISCRPTYCLELCSIRRAH